MDKIVKYARNSAKNIFYKKTDFESTGITYSRFHELLRKHSTALRLDKPGAIPPEERLLIEMLQKQINQREKK